MPRARLRHLAIALRARPSGERQLADAFDVQRGRANVLRLEQVDELRGRGEGGQHRQLAQAAIHSRAAKDESGINGSTWDTTLGASAMDMVLTITSYSRPRQKRGVGTLCYVSVSSVGE